MNVVSKEEIADTSRNKVVIVGSPLLVVIVLASLNANVWLKSIVIVSITFITEVFSKDIF